MEKALSSFLRPFSYLYAGITTWRNRQYDKGKFRSVEFNLPLLNVGNLRVGGTGKSPHVEYLIRFLKADYSICTLSRGYARKSKGFIMAQAHSTAREIGDEPRQYVEKFYPEIGVAVGENRVEAVPQILMEREDCNLILLDDAFQHRAIRPYFNILLSDYHHPFYQDHPFPAGRLRESRLGAKRADVIIVTKCPKDIEPSEKKAIRESIRSYARKDCPVFFTRMLSALPVAVNFSAAGTEENWEETKEVFLFSAIAQAQPLEDYVKSKFQLIKHWRFRDHHYFTGPEIKQILQDFEAHPSPNKVLLCTEKDWVKLAEPMLKETLKGYPLYYIPIEVEFLEKKEEEEFQNLILKALADFPE